MTLRTIRFDDEQWQVVPKRMTEQMRDRLHGDIRILCDPIARTADIQNDLEVWESVLAAAPEPPAQEPAAEPVAWLHDVVAGDREPDQALSFSPDNFPLEGVGGFRSVRCRPLYFGPPAPAQEPMTAERDALEDVLLRAGFVRCNIAACNCGSWHHRYGLPERFEEIKEALADAGHPLTNDNGHIVLRALGELIAERDALREALEWYASMSKRMGNAAIAGDSQAILALMKDVAVDYGGRARAALADGDGA